MTEDEAKTKWCPFVRVAERLDGGPLDMTVAVNRPFNTASFDCIASDCMAWRGVDKVGGYCGLAGKPFNGQ